MPFPKLPTVTLDAVGDSVGIAQLTARGKNLQGRVLWVDATANLDRYNSPAEIHDIVTQAKNSGFNTLVLDVKPIIGYTIYPSHIAGKLANWKGSQLGEDYDPLDLFIKEAHAVNLQICANFAVFSEGHKYFNKGLAYTKPKLQTVLYQATRSVKPPVMFAPSFNISDSLNSIPADPNVIGVFTDPAALKKVTSGLIVVTDSQGRIAAEVDPTLTSPSTVVAPPQGAILVTQGKAADTFRSTTHIGDTLTFTSTPRYVQCADDPTQKITVFVNPNDPEVQQHELDIVKEVVVNYPVDGVIFDDRLRFAGLNADFSPQSMQQFEQYVGRPLKWPDDVFQYNPMPNQDIIKGPQFEAWNVWRALTIRNWLAKAKATVKFYRPQATFSVYAGSWYGEYGGMAENYAADDYNGAFDFNTPNWRKTGFAGMLDWITTGCYYKNATIADGGASPGSTVEGAGQLSNRVINDQTWTYAGLYALMYNRNNDDFGKAIQAAAASSQGVMIFDVSQLYDQKLWPVVQAAFGGAPTQAPHQVPGLIDTVRSQRVAPTAASAPVPATLKGSEGTGL
jgi:uncharacterized lipoprotein YddW (UPF0748 family)